MFNVNRRNNQFLYASTVIEDEEALPQALSSDPNFARNPNPISTSSPNITSILKYNYKGVPLLYSTITPGAYELTDIAEIIKEESDGNVIIEPDKNTMKCLMEIKQGALSFDIENSIASLLGFRKIIYIKGKYKSQKNIDIMGFNNINIHCNIISGAKDNGKDTDILYTFNLTEPPGYLINIIPTNILYQNVTKDRIENIEFHIKDEHGRPIDFNGDVLSFIYICVNTAGRRPIWCRYRYRYKHKHKHKHKLNYKTLRSQLILSLPLILLFLVISMTV